jgi:hypothetical protein
MDLGLVVASVVVAVAGLVVLAALPNRAQQESADPSSPFDADLDQRLT